MNRKKYLFEIRVIQMFVLPVWSVYKIVTDRKVRQRKVAGIFLLIWVTLQWLVLLGSGSNLIASLVYSNLSISLFFLVNIYFAIDFDDFSENERALLNQKPLKFTATVTAFIIMYSVPEFVTRIYSQAGIALLAGEIYRSKFHIISSILLIAAWFVFMIADNYRIFLLFPKTEFKGGLYRLMPLTSEKIMAFYFMYIMLAIMFISQV